ncbi:MAG: hypothetical protein HOC79_04530 [Euryarchaeota archaeon]|nr:hypothetical protein [Euryarchaeota archaeon]
MPKIRLIRKDGGLLNLDATSFSISITRAIPVIPIPVLAERLGIDTNSVAADIQIDVILADDDCAKTEFQSRIASCSIDFGVDADTSSGQSQQWFGGTVSLADLDDKSFNISTLYQSTSRIIPPIRVKFDTGTVLHSSTGGGSNPTTTVGIQGVLNAADLATAVKAALDVADYAPTQVATSGATTFASAFSTEIESSKIIAAGNSKLKITQVELGGNGNNDTPIFWTDADNEDLTKPSHTLFRGGSAHDCKSAGDKLQDLIAYVGNASLMGGVGSVFDFFGSEAGGEGGGFELPTDFSLSGDIGADYIIGIQIPYNSLVQKTVVDSTNDGYVARNLLIISGMNQATAQSSKGNILPSGVVFDVTDKFTGIRGTVTGMNMSYDAGNNIYDGTITFQPLDLMVGL